MIAGWEGQTYLDRSGKALGAALKTALCNQMSNMILDCFLLSLCAHSKLQSSFALESFRTFHSQVFVKSCYSPEDAYHFNSLLTQIFGVVAKVRYSLKRPWNTSMVYLPAPDCITSDTWFFCTTSSKRGTGPSLVA